MVVEAEADFHVGGEVFSGDGEADDFGTIRTNHDGLGIGGFAGTGDGEGADFADGDDMAGIRAAGNHVGITRNEGIGKEAACGGGHCAGGLAPVEGGIGLDDGAADAGDVPGVAVVGFEVKGCAEIGTADYQCEGVRLGFAFFGSLG